MKYHVLTLIVLLILLPGCLRRHEKPDYANLVPTNDSLPKSLTKQQAVSLAQSNPLALIEYTLSHYNATVTDYTATLYKNEQLRGKLRGWETIDIKFLDNPFSLLMVWQDNPILCDRLLYVENQNDGEIILHPTAIVGFMKTLRSHPDNPLTRFASSSPIYEFGIYRKIATIYKAARDAQLTNQLTTTALPYPNQPDKINCELNFSSKEMKSQPNITITLDLNLMLPVELHIKDKNQQTISHYRFENLKFNTGLTPDDFSLTNAGFDN